MRFILLFCEIIKERLERVHIGCFSGMDKPLLLISADYPGVWLEHVYDSVMYAKLENDGIELAKNTVELFMEKHDLYCKEEIEDSVRIDLHKNFRNDITLQEIAKYSSFSPHYVSQLFHAETSLTLTQYVTKLRLEYAKNLLYSGYTVELAATMSGFSDAKYFSRVVKKHFGCTPRELKNYGK